MSIIKFYYNSVFCILLLKIYTKQTIGIELQWQLYFPIVVSETFRKYNKISRFWFESYFILEYAY